MNIDEFKLKWGTKAPLMMVEQLINQATKARDEDGPLATTSREMATDLKSALETSRSENDVREECAKFCEKVGSGLKEFQDRQLHAAGNIADACAQGIRLTKT